MKRRAMLVLPLSVMFLFGGWLGYLEAQRPPAWQMLVVPYLQTTKPAMVVQHVAHATLPWLLTSALHGQVLDYGAYCYNAEGVPENGPTCALALPYPPEEVFCVLVGNEQAQHLLLAARFADHLYHNDWVLLAGPLAPSFAETLQVADGIGCDFAQRQILTPTMQSDSNHPQG